MPTATLPLKLRSSQRAIIAAALEAPDPLTRLIVVVTQLASPCCHDKRTSLMCGILRLGTHCGCAHRWGSPGPASLVAALQTCMERLEPGAALCLVGCIAEIKQLKWQSNGTCHAVTRGRQRASIIATSIDSCTQLVQLQHCMYNNAEACTVVDARPVAELCSGCAAVLRYAEVVILADEEASPLPREASQGLAFWPLPVWRLFDAYTLAREAAALCASKLHDAGGRAGSPLGLSWWLAANLPVDDMARQKMLQAPTAAVRLQLALRALRGLGNLMCLNCGCQVYSDCVSAVFRMSALRSAACRKPGLQAPS